MRPLPAEAFFRILGKRFQSQCRVVLTGGIAAGLMGRVRQTGDIDFAAIPSNQKTWPQDEAAMLAEARQRRIVLQYSSDIGRWSMISLLDWQKHTLPHKRFGKVELRLLHPFHWSIGKISRYEDRDRGDLEAVFKKQKVKWQEVLGIWARALRDSPSSERQFQFKKQAETFLKASGGRIWGKNFSADEAIARFRKNLGIKN